MITDGYSTVCIPSNQFKLWPAVFSSTSQGAPLIQLSLSREETVPGHQHCHSQHWQRPNQISVMILGLLVYCTSHHSRPDPSFIPRICLNSIEFGGTSAVTHWMAYVSSVSRLSVHSSFQSLTALQPVAHFHPSFKVQAMVSAHPPWPALWQAGDFLRWNKKYNFYIYIRQFACIQVL